MGPPDRGMLTSLTKTMGPVEEEEEEEEEAAEVTEAAAAVAAEEERGLWDWGEVRMFV